MIDKNGKLFGKINLIDLIIVLVIILVVVFVALRVTGVGGGDEGAAPVRISMFASEVPDYVLEYLVEGDSVMDFTEETELGTVESFETGEPFSYETTTNGEVQSVVKKGHKSLTLNVTGNAVLGEHGATIGGELYGVGHTLTVFAGKAKIFLRISGIEAIS